MKKIGIILLCSLALVLVVEVIYGFFVLTVVNVVPPGNCLEAYEGSIPGLNYGSAGAIYGIFNYTGAPNTTTGGPLTPQVFYDTCLNNNTLLEFVCGSNVPPGFPQYARAVMVQCGEPGVPGTQCLQVPIGVGTGIWAGECQ